MGSMSDNMFAAQTLDVSLVATLKSLEPGRFQIVCSEEIDILGFIGWDDEVENLDPEGHYGRQPSRHLLWKRGVEFVGSTVRASSVALANEALQHVTVLFAE